MLATLQLSLQPPWWTRTQRIQVAPTLALEIQVGPVESPPAYQRMAPRAPVLTQLRLSESVVGRHLRVTDKTVRKAPNWHREHLRLDPEPA